jgi:hypothetical protein
MHLREELDRHGDGRAFGDAHVGACRRETGAPRRHVVCAWRHVVEPDGAILAIAPSNELRTFYRRSTDQGRSFSEPIRIGSTIAGRPSLATAGTTVWLAWKESLGNGTAIRALRSDDAGLTWSAAREVARTSGNSDYPFLVGRTADTFLSWFTAEEGYRLIPLR